MRRMLQSAVARVCRWSHNLVNCFDEQIGHDLSVMHTQRCSVLDADEGRTFDRYAEPSGDVTFSTAVISLRHSHDNEHHIQVSQ